MYPKLSDLINDLFGTSINLPVQSYGFFLALAFLVAAIVLYLELKRKENEGLIEPTTDKIWIGKPVSITELLIGFVISTAVGFKLVGAATNYSFFADKPQEFLLSTDGSWIGGLVIGVIYTFYTYYQSNKNKLDPPIQEEVVIHAQQQTWPIVFIGVVFGIMGAKVFHWLENWDEFMADPIDSLTSFSGLTFYGGLITGVLAGGYYTAKKGIKLRHMSDIIAPALMIAYGVGRIGCHVAGDGDWGIVNTLTKPQWLSWLPDWLWAYNYPHNILNEGVLIPGCTGAHCHQLAMPVFPTPVYETTMSVIIFLILWFLRKRLRIAGQLFAIYLMFNGLERFFIEKIRVNNVFDFLGMNVTQAEVISTLLFISGLSLFIFYQTQTKKLKI